MGEAAQSRNTMRRSQRLSSSGTKSRYFEDDVFESDASTAKPVARKRKSNTKHQDQSSDDLELDNGNVESESSTEDEASVQLKAAVPKKKGKPAKPNPKKRQADSNLVDQPSKKGRGRPAKATPANKSKAESDHDDDDQDSDDEGPIVEFIPLPKLRDTGGIEYEPTTVHPNTMAFLADLKANNQRSWLKSPYPPPSHPFR